MWEIDETNLDRTFLGQWEITRVDDYLTEKAGTVTRTAVVRSVVDIKTNTINLYAHLPSRYGLDPIVVNGSFGLCGRITERIKVGESRLNINCLYLRLIKPDETLKNLKEIAPKRYVLRGKAEFDDVVFNSQGKFSFSCVYYFRGKQPYLWGLSLSIPIDKFNHYIKMRDIWYQDYDGSKIITAD